MDINDAVYKARSGASTGGAGATFLVENRGDGKVYLHQQSFHSGFLVSDRGGIEGLPDSMFRAEFLLQYIMEYMRELCYPRIGEKQAYLGVWQDEYGKWSIDISRLYVTPIGTAMVHASNNGQRAIWDCRQNQAISL